MKKIMTGWLCILMCTLLLIPVYSTNAAVKPVAEKSITVSLNKKHPIKYCMLHLSDAEALTEIQIKVTEIKGKPSEKQKPMFITDSIYGKGPMWWDDVEAGKIKKGAYIPIDVTKSQGNAFFQFDMPKGVKSIRYKVTFSDTEKKKTIENVTLEKSWDVWGEYLEKVYES